MHIFKSDQFDSEKTNEQQQQQQHNRMSSTSNSFWKYLEDSARNIYVRAKKIFARQPSSPDERNINTSTWDCNGDVALVEVAAKPRQSTYERLEVEAAAAEKKEESTELAQTTPPLSDIGRHHIDDELEDKVNAGKNQSASGGFNSSITINSEEIDEIEVAHVEDAPIATAVVEDPILMLEEEEEEDDSAALLIPSASRTSTLVEMKNNLAARAAFAESFEDKLEACLNKLGISFETERDLKIKQSPLTPDFLISSHNELYITVNRNRVRVNWIDAKNMYGINPALLKKFGIDDQETLSGLKKQFDKYSRNFGPGLAVFNSGFNSELSKVFGETLLLSKEAFEKATRSRTEDPTSASFIFETKVDLNTKLFNSVPDAFEEFVLGSVRKAPYIYCEMEDEEGEEVFEKATVAKKTKFFSGAWKIKRLIKQIRDKFARKYQDKREREVLGLSKEEKSRFFDDYIVRNVPLEEVSRVRDAAPCIIRKVVFENDILTRLKTNAGGFLPFYRVPTFPMFTPTTFSKKITKASEALNIATECEREENESHKLDLIIEAFRKVIDQFPPIIETIETSTTTSSPFLEDLVKGCFLCPKALHGLSDDLLDDLVVSLSFSQAQKGVNKELGTSKSTAKAIKTTGSNRIECIKSAPPRVALTCERPAVSPQKVLNLVLSKPEEIPAEAAAVLIRAPAALSAVASSASLASSGLSAPVVTANCNNMEMLYNNLTDFILTQKRAKLMGVDLGDFYKEYPEMKELMKKHKHGVVKFRPKEGAAKGILVYHPEGRHYTVEVVEATKAHATVSKSAPSLAPSSAVVTAAEPISVVLCEESVAAAFTSIRAAPPIDAAEVEVEVDDNGCGEEAVEEAEEDIEELLRQADLSLLETSLKLAWSPMVKISD